MGNCFGSEVLALQQQLKVKDDMLEDKDKEISSMKDDLKAKEEKVVLTERLYEQLLTQHPSQELNDSNLLLSRLSERNRLKNLQLSAQNKELAKNHLTF